MTLVRLFRLGLWLLAAVPLLPLLAPPAAAQGAVSAEADSTDRPVDLASYCRFFRTSPYCAPALSGDDGAPRLYLVYFDPQSEAIRPGEEAMLRAAAAAALLEPAAPLAVTGHADRVGSDEAALDLSVRRAAAVAGWLEAQGVEGARISLSGAGFSRPMLPAHSGTQENLNRRVEILLDLH